MKKTKRKSISKLKKDADRVFSLWVRARTPYCVTCGSRNNLQAGHYVSRSINQLRYDPRNVWTQCVACNMFKNGAMDEYALFLGHEMLLVLKKEKQVLKQWKREELESIIAKYQL